MHPYRIIISGDLDESDREAFADFRIESDGTTTVLTAEIDQAGLYGALRRIRALGLELVALTRMDYRTR